MGSLCWLPYPHPGSAEVTYFVTLKILSNRSARRTLIPKEVPGLMAAHTTSKMLPTMTCNGDGFSPVLHAHACVQLSPPACGCLSLQAPAVSLVCSPSHTGHCKGHASRSSCSPRELRRVRRSCCPRSLLLYPDVPGGHGTERGQACGFLMDGKPTYLAPPRPAPHHSLTASRLLTSRRQAARYRQPGPPAVPTGQRSPLPRTPEPWCGLRPDTFGFTS